ncbi:MAG TPA: LLM class flavin-dependent oxidoreductase [Blastocatellia bacterium]|nr:LLM class flavin-dependent oxidoreductase [Blastocatellia bacterium]
MNTEVNTNTNKVRYGFWMPIFGGWLRNVDDEKMYATFDYNKRLARRAEEIGFDISLLAELNLNDIKGADAPVLECWTTSAALAGVTEKLELMNAIRPGFRLPAITAKMAANIDQISGGRFSLNVVSAWWEQEMRQYGGEWIAHDKRYERTREFIEVMRGMWTEDEFDYEGAYYTIEKGHLEPKPIRKPGPTIYAGGESEDAKNMIARHCDGYLMHGDTVENVRPKVADMERRRQALGLSSMTYGIAAYVICRKNEREVKEEIDRITNVKDAAGYFGFKDFTTQSQLERELSLRDYSVSNRGLRTGLTGTPEQIAERIIEFRKAGVEIFLMQMSPMLEEMERFAEEVMPMVNAEFAAFETPELALTIGH